MKHEKELCRATLHELGCNDEQIESVLEKTNDVQEATKLGLQMLGINTRSPLSPPTAEALNVWRLTELGFPEDLAFNALMATVC